MSWTKEWRALDHCDEPEEKAPVTEEAEQTNYTDQTSEEWIIIKDSEGVDVQTTDTQAAVSLQAGIQVAIAVVISISIADDNQAEVIMQDLNEMFRARQSNKQKTIVEKSKNVEIETTDTAAAVNIQLLIQILVAIVVTLDIL